MRVRIPAQVILITLAWAMLAGIARADVSGTWTAQYHRSNGQVATETYTLKQAGNTVTGWVVRSWAARNPSEISHGDTTDISNGQVQGDTLTFQVKFEDHGQSDLTHYKGKIAGDQIQFVIRNSKSVEVPATAKLTKH